MDVTANDSPIFQARLTPYRSLKRGGFVVLVSITLAVTCAHAVVFFMANAWPVAAFFGLDLVLLYGAFWLSYRSGRACEEVQISRTELNVRKVAPSGRETVTTFNPFWARFQVSRHEEIGITGMKIEGQGRRTEVGSFLNPPDRESFATAFSHALATAKQK